MNSIPAQPGTTGWQPIETAPQDRSTYVLASFPKGFVGIAHRGRVCRDEFTNMKHEYFAPTHWMPLPEPPL